MATSERNTLPPVENLARIAAAAQTIANAADGILRSGKNNLSLADWALLQRLAAEEEGQLMTRLAVQSGVTRQRVQQQLDALGDAKLVTMMTTDDDKRTRTVKLTALGRDTLRRVSTYWSQKLSREDVLEKLKNSDAVRLRLERIAGALCKAARDETKGAQAARVAARAGKKA